MVTGLNLRYGTSEKKKKKILLDEQAELSLAKGSFMMPTPEIMRKNFKSVTQVRKQ